VESVFRFQQVIKMDSFWFIGPGKAIPTRNPNPAQESQNPQPSKVRTPLDSFSWDRS